MANCLDAVECALLGQRMTAPHMNGRFIVSYDGANIRSEWPSGTGNLWTPGAVDRVEDWVPFIEPTRNKWGVYDE